MNMINQTNTMTTKTIATGNTSAVRKNKGFTMLIAVVTGTILLLIAYGMANIALRQQVLASGARDSQVAFYAADSALECAQYLDTDHKAFMAIDSDTAHPAGAMTLVGNYCGGVMDPVQSIVRKSYTSTGDITPGDFIFKIQYTIPGQPMMCAQVTVSKSKSTGSAPDVVGTAGQLKTVIDARGYNTCDTTSPNRLERAIRAVYYEAF